MEQRSAVRLFAGVFLILLLGWTCEGLLTPPTKFWSPPQNTGQGTARTYVQTDFSNSLPIAVGIRVDGSNFFWPNKEHSEYFFEMPQGTQAYTPFVEIDYGFSPNGHPPKIYEEPHVDVHFYLTPKQGSLSHITPGDDCNGMSIEGWCRSVKPFRSSCCPPGMVQAGAVVPFMGSHLIDPTYTKFNKQFIWGAMDGYISFMELKASLKFLLQLKNGTKSSGCEPIPGMPQEFKIAGNYPTSWCVNYDQMSASYTFELRDFNNFPSGGCDSGKKDACVLIPPSPKLPKKCDCDRYPPYPKFVPVPPPSGTGNNEDPGTTFSASGKGHSGHVSGSGGGSSSSSSSTSTSTSSGSHGGHTSSGGSSGSSGDHGSDHKGSKGSEGSGGHEGHSSGGGSHDEGKGEKADFLTFVSQQQVHTLYMASLAIIGFFFLAIAVSFSLYGSTVSISLCRAQKNNRQLGLILKMVGITLLLTAIFAARCALIIWENSVHSHEVNSHYLWRSYFLPEIIPALLILLLDLIQIFGENKKAIVASMATLGFTSKSKATTSTFSAASPVSGAASHTYTSATKSADTASR